MTSSKVRAVHNRLVYPLHDHPLCASDLPTRDFTVDLDVEQIEPLTKADIIAFFDQYLNPASPSRAKISVHMVAQSSAKDIAKTTSPQDQTEKILVRLTQFLNSQGVVADPEKLAARLEGVNAAGGDVEGLVNAIFAYLVQDQNVEMEKVKVIIEQGKALMGTVLPSVGVDVTASSTVPEKNGSEEVVVAGKEPEFITDVHTFKASLGVSAGARPVKDLSEFEETEAKL